MRGSDSLCWLLVAHVLYLASGLPLPQVRSLLGSGRATQLHKSRNTLL